MTAEAPRATRLGIRIGLRLPCRPGGIFGLAPWEFMFTASLVINSTVKKEDVEIHRGMANGQD